MEHPLISGIDDLTVEQLQTRISDLTKKLGWAHRSGNGDLASQISMALETFNNKYQQRVQELYEKSNKSGKDFSDRIDIS